MAKKDRSIIVKTQDGGAIVEVKNVFLDSSQKDFSITGNIVGEFDDFHYSRFVKCEECEEEKKCEDCRDGACYYHNVDRLISDPFDSEFCNDCEFENIEETKMMILARYNFKFEALYELEKLINAIATNTRTYTFEKRLKISDMLDIAFANGVTKEIKTFEVTRGKKIRTYNKTIYEGYANVEIKNRFFFICVEESTDNLPGEQLSFYENGDFMFKINL